MVVKHCAYGLCTSDSRSPEDGVFFLPFVKPLRHRERCMKWVEACNRVGFTVDSIKKDTYICSKHFVGMKGPTKDNPDPTKAMPDDSKAANSSFRLRKRLANNSSDSSTCQEDTESGTLSTNEFSIVIVPENWSSMISGTNILFFKYANEKHVLTIKINESLHPKLLVLGKELPVDHFLNEKIPPKLSSCQEVSNFISMINSWKICSGIPESKYSSLRTQYEDCETVDSTRAIHHIGCSLLTSSKYCKKCSALKSKLASKLRRQKNGMSLPPKPGCNYRYMDAETLKHHLRKKTKHLNLAEKKLNRLI